MPTGGDGTAYMGEGINSALKAFSKLPAKQRLPLGFAGLFAAGATTRAIQKVKKYMDDKNIDLQVNKYVAARQIPGGPKKIDPSPFNAPHHVNYMKTKDSSLSRAELAKKSQQDYLQNNKDKRNYFQKKAGLHPAHVSEKMDLKKADMGDVIKDFYKSDAPQFKGRSKEKRREMAIAAKLEADEVKEGKTKTLQYIGAGLTGLGIGTLLDRKMKKVFGDPSKKLDKNSERFLKTGKMQEGNIQEILDKKDVPHIKKLIKKLKDGSELHAKQSKDLEKVMKEQLGGTGPKVAPSPQEMKKKLTPQSLDARKQAQSKVIDKMNQLGGVTKTTSQNGKLSSMSIQGVGSGTNKDALASVLPKSGTGLKMDADGVVPDAGAAVQQQAMKGIKIGQNTMSNNPTKFTSTQKQDFNTAKNYATSGQIKTDINRQIPGTQQFRYDIAADEINLASQKNKPKTNKGIKVENTAIESELVIQDWNSDDIKFTEIETVDIIKAKPLKENSDLYEGFKTRMIAKFGKKLLKNIGKVNPFTKTGAERVTQGMSQVKKYVPPDKVTSQNIQTKSVVNQAKKMVDMSKKPNKGTKAVKVDLSKPIDFDKYLGKTSNKIQKKFGSETPTGTFTDDLPPVKTVPLNKSQIDLMKKTNSKKIKKKLTMKDKMKEIKNDPMSKQIQKEIEKETGTKTRKFSQKGGVTKGNENEILSNVKPKPKNPLKDHYDWRTEIDEDWQKVNRQDKTDGLSRKAVKAYRRENPGSKLQTAVTKDPKKLKKGSKSAKRRLSFCRRMKGMKKKLTSAKTRRDPDSRINKALRRWNC